MSSEEADFKKFLEQNQNLRSMMYDEGMEAMDYDSNGATFQPSFADEVKTIPIVQLTNAGNLKETYRCYICKLDLSSRDTMRMHANGRDHLTRISALTATNELPEVIIEAIDNESPMRTKVAIPLQSKILATNQPLVGLECVEEFLPMTEDRTLEPKYICFLCDSKGQANGILQHLHSQTHLFNYFSMRFPEDDFSSASSIVLENLSKQHDQKQWPQLIRTYKSDDYFEWPEGKRPIINRSDGGFEVLGEILDPDLQPECIQSRNNVKSSAAMVRVPGPNSLGEITNDAEANSSLIFVQRFSSILSQVCDTQALSSDLSILSIMAMECQNSMKAVRPEDQPPSSFLSQRGENRDYSNYNSASRDSYRMRTSNSSSSYQRRSGSSSESSGSFRSRRRSRRHSRSDSTSAKHC